MGVSYSNSVGGFYINNVGVSYSNVRAGLTVMCGRVLQ